MKAAQSDGVRQCLQRRRLVGVLDSTARFGDRSGLALAQGGLFGLAALAGPKPALFGFGDRRMKADVFPARHARGARRPAVNARGPHREIELLVRGRISLEDRLPFFVIRPENRWGMQNFFRRWHCLGSLQVDGRQPPFLSRTLDPASRPGNSVSCFQFRRSGRACGVLVVRGWIASTPSTSFSPISRECGNARICHGNRLAFGGLRVDRGVLRRGIRARGGKIFHRARAR